MKLDLKHAETKSDSTTMTDSSDAKLTEDRNHLIRIGLIWVIAVLLFILAVIVTVMIIKLVRRRFKKKKEGELILVPLM